MKIDARVHSVVREQRYPLVFVTISGAHLYGFPSPAPKHPPGPKRELDPFDPEWPKTRPTPEPKA